MQTANAIATAPQAMVLSADGSYLYIGGNPLNGSATIVRCNTVSWAVDLQWQVPAATGNYGSGIVSMATPPDSPQTLIISTYSDILIYDRDQHRLFDATAAGFPAFQGHRLLFAGQKRIYGNLGYTAPNTTGFCLTWLNYDAFGISTF